MIPFHVQLRPGISIYEQIVYAAKKAIISGTLLPGSVFPSVRTISRELKVNPNTAHKVITKLMTDGLLESRPGVGTLVAERGRGSAAERTELLGREMEELVVEAKKLGISLEDFSNALSQHWEKLSQNSPGNSRVGERKRP